MNQTTNDLPGRIAACCGLDESPLLARLESALGDFKGGKKGTPSRAKPRPVAAACGKPRPAPEPQERERLFALPRPRLPLRIASATAFSAYLKKVTDLRELREFAAAHWDDGQSVIPKLVLKMVERIEKDEKPAFDGDGSDAEALAEYVRNKVLERHVKKLSETLFAKSAAGGSPTARELLQILHRYLRQLGVYTVVASPAALYRDDVELYYECINPITRENCELVVDEVIRPAYALDYKDGDDILRSQIQAGSCTLRREEHGTL